MQLNKGRLISLCIIILKLAFTPFNNIYPQYSPKSIAEIMCFIQQTIPHTENSIVLCLKIN